MQDDEQATRNAVKGDLDLVHTREIPEPVGRVYGAFMDPGKLPRWWGPEGFTCRTESIALEPGGEWRVALLGPDGREYDNVYQFVELKAPGLVVVDHVSGHWFRLTITLEPAPAGTRVTWKQTFETRAARDEMVALCVPGNEQNLDKLAAFLAAERG
jgi:uncharacterized protein YndB with AHSA1/START domain